MFYYYSVCSRSICLHLIRSLYLILLYYLFALASVFFILLLFGKDLMTLPVLRSFFSFSLFSFSLFCFCSFYASFMLLFLFFLFFCSLLSALLYATPVLANDLLLIFFSFLPSLPLFFSFNFIYLFIFSFLLLLLLLLFP